MEYSTADTIAYRLSKTSPWREYGDVRSTGGVPNFVCVYCDETKEFGYVGTHDPECLWLNARQYIDLLNAPVASQEPAESPIESRVSELLGETEKDDSAPMEDRVNARMAGLVDAIRGMRR